MVIDTTITSNALPITAYVRYDGQGGVFIGQIVMCGHSDFIMKISFDSFHRSVPIGVGESASGLFVPVTCQTSLPDADRVACGSSCDG